MKEIFHGFFIDIESAASIVFYTDTIKNNVRGMFGRILVVDERKVFKADIKLKNGEWIYYEFDELVEYETAMIKCRKALLS